MGVGGVGVGVVGGGFGRGVGVLREVVEQLSFPAGP